MTGTSYSANPVCHVPRPKDILWDTPAAWKKLHYSVKRFCESWLRENQLHIKHQRGISVLILYSPRSLVSSEKLSQRKKLVIFFFYFHLQLPSLQASLCFCSTLAKHHLSLKQCGLWSRLLRLFSAKYGRIRAGYIQTLLAHPALKKFPDVLCLCFFPNNIKECQQKWDEVWKPAVQKFSKWVLLCYEDELSSDYSTTFCTPG